MSGDSSCASAETRIVWLSGGILTFLSKVVMPTVWVGILIGVPIWAYVTIGHLSIKSDFRFIVWFALIASVPLTWFTVHLQLVGYRGEELIVANYWREARIPFADIQAVEPVWWYKGRLVRIRFKRQTAFGSLVYYMPKWGPLLAMFSAPEEELRTVVGMRSRYPEI